MFKSLGQKALSFLRKPWKKWVQGVWHEKCATFQVARILEENKFGEILDSGQNDGK